MGAFWGLNKFRNITTVKFFTIFVGSLLITGCSWFLVELMRGNVDVIKAFFDYQVPQAVIKLKQGFGRLIRTATDRGQVVVFDPRVLTKGYGKQFLDALPKCRTFVDGVEEK